MMKRFQPLLLLVFALLLPHSLLAQKGGAPIITTQPQNRTVTAGQAATFTIAVGGLPELITYQWQRRPAGGTFANLANGGNYSGVLTGTLTVSNTTLAMSGDEFRCQVSNGIPPSLPSNGATLTVTSLEVALPNLLPYTPAGWSGSLVAKTATGANVDATTIFDDQEIFIDWSYVNSSTADITTRTEHRLLIDGTSQNTWWVDSLQAGWYFYWHDYSIGRLPAGTHTLRMEYDYLQALTESSESDNVFTRTITVLPRSAAPSVTRQPQSQTVLANQSATFTIAATGNPTTFTYTWQRMPAGTTVWSNLANGGSYSGATTVTLTVSNVVASMSNDQFRCIAANGVNPAATSSAATLSVATASQAAPSNNFANRALLTGSSTTANGSNVGATKETGEPNHAGANGGASVWWTWTAPSSGVVTISTVGSSFDTVLAVYTGTSLTSLVTIASDDDSGGGVASSVTFNATSGTTYQIAVDGYGGVTGTIVLRLSLTATSGTVGGTSSSRLINVSTRGVVQAGGTLTPGFVIRGTGSKQLLIRGLGPVLANFGVTGTLSDPRLDVIPIGSSNPITTNDNWVMNNVTTLAGAASAVGAFALPSGSRDAAVLATLSLSSQLSGYTVRISPVAGSTAGVALAEVYDMDGPAAATKLVNISTLGFVGTGGNVIICGFVIVGNGPKQLLIRAVGDGLSRFGVGGLLVDPTLQVFQGSTQIAANDDWVSTPALRAAMNSAGAFTLTDNSLDSVLLLVLQPGTYTAQVAGFAATTGNALIEVYDLDP